MTTDIEQVAIKAVGEAIARGFRERDPGEIASHYAPGAVIFDLAPPLAHPFNPSGLAAWMDTWRGPIEQRIESPTIIVGGDLAVCHGLARVKAVSVQGGEQAEWWQRATICLRKLDGAWKVVHEHTSVPFYMDGSYRAAIDLQP